MNKLIILVQLFSYIGSAMLIPMVVLLYEECKPKPKARKP